MAEKRVDILGGDIMNSMKAVDWSGVYKKYRGLWVALAQDEQTVLASGKTAKEAWDTALEKGFRKPILTRMPERLISFIGSHL